MANRADLDQMPLTVVSDLGLHCLQRHICPNTKGYYGKKGIDYSCFSGKLYNMAITA